MSSSFKSTTDRSVANLIKQDIEKNSPSFGTYEESRMMGRASIEGGAPNNFLLLR